MNAKILSVLALILAAAQAAASGGGGGGVSPENAWKMLREGNERYARGLAVNPHSSKERRDEVRGSQHPFATVFSCSDSRVPTERVFDQGIGDLFVVRVAGNHSSSADVVGTVEYGFLHLGSNLLLVMGHESCGAVKAALGHHKEPGTSIEAMIAPIIPAADAASDALVNVKGADLVAEAVERNVQLSMHNLLMDSPKLAARVKEGTLKVVGGVYHLSNGRVSWMGEHPDQDEIVEKSLAAEKARSKGKGKKAAGSYGH